MTLSLHIQKKARFASIFFSVLIALTFGNLAFGQTTVPVTEYITASDALYFPCGATDITITAYGGGGGGGGSANNGHFGGGGGSGFVSTSSQTITAGSTLNIVIGAGGIGGDNSPATGNAGGLTSVTGSFGTIVALGGLGGGTGNDGPGGGGCNPGIQASSGTPAAGGDGCGPLGGTGGDDGNNGCGDDGTNYSAGGGGGEQGCGGDGAPGYVVITYNVVADAGSDLTIGSCNTGTSLLAVESPYGAGTGTWTQTGGPAGSGFFPNANDINAVFLGMTAGNTYDLTWTIDDGGTCPVVADVMSITVDPAPTSVAGIAQTACGGGNVDLTGATGTNGTFLWDDGGAGGSFDDATSLTAIYTAPAGPASVTLTLTTTPSGGCPSVSSSLILTVTAGPTIPIAGPNQVLAACDTDAQLAANVILSGTGQWQVTTSPLGGPAPIYSTNDGDPVASVSGLGLNYVYSFVWVVTSGSCTPLVSNVDITTSTGPGCNVYCTPATTLGTTYSITDVSFSDLSNSSSESTLPMYQDNTGMCAGVQPDGSYNLCVSGTTGASGVNVAAYFDWNNDGDFNDVGETFNVGSAPTGVWGPLCVSVTIPAGAVIGSTVMRIMAIRDTEPQGPCLTTISYGETEDYCVNICETTAPNAGADQILAICDTDAILDANLISNGTGTWALFSGAGTIVYGADTTVTGLGEGDNIFSWTVTDGSCPTLVSYVTITTSGTITVDAGVNLITCNPSISLSGSDPAGDVGLWTVVSGPAGSSFGDDSSPTSTFNTVLDGLYTLQWSVTNACGPTVDQMTVSVGSTLPVAYAGPDQTGICPFSATMAATDVTGLTGVWSFVSGPTTAGISDPSSSSTNVTGLSATSGTYIFQWDISGGGCAGSSSSQVSISMDNCTNTLTHSATSDQTVSGCNFTYTDDGGAGGDYTDGVTLTSTTICPDSPDQYVTIDFTSIDLGAYIYDNLVVFDELTDAAAMIGYADGAGELQLTNPASGDPIVSSGGTYSGGLGGCLTIQFTSFDVNTSTLDVGSGWVATTGCTTVQGTPITQYISGTNCGGGGGITLCAATSNIDPDTQFQGGQMDLTVGAVGGVATPGGNNGCMGSGESNEQWVYFNVVTDGYVQFTFDAAGGQDFDWAIWGPYPGASCPLNTGDQPIRCSWATSGQNTCTGTHLTGLAFTVPAAVAPPMGGLSTAGDFSEEGNGCVDDGNGYNDGFVEPIYAYAGEVFTMLINNYSNNNSSYTFDYITDGAEAGLGCDPPVVLGAEIMDFTGVAESRHNKLIWTTETEQNNDYFVLEGSTNSHVWKELGTVKGSGNSNSTQNYSFDDYIMTLPITYYRLKQVDYDGSFTYSQAIALTRGFETNNIVSNIYPNPSDDVFYFNYGGRDFTTPITVEVYNTLGQIVKTQEYLKFNKHVALSFSREDLVEGLYQVKISQGEVYETQRISIVK